MYTFIPQYDALTRQCIRCTYSRTVPMYVRKPQLSVDAAIGNLLKCNAAELNQGFKTPSRRYSENVQLTLRTMNCRRLLLTRLIY